MGQGRVLTLRVEHQLLFLQSRPCGAVDELTLWEFTVAQLAARGNTNKEIADMLHRSPATVRTQIRSVYNKLCVGNVAGLIEAVRSPPQSAYAAPDSKSGKSTRNGESGLPPCHIKPLAPLQDHIKDLKADIYHP